MTAFKSCEYKIEPHGQAQARFNPATTKEMKTLAVLAPVCLVGALAAFLAPSMLKSAPADETMPQVGQQAPEFTLTSQDGSELGPKDFKGKWVVLYFYPKDNTPGCTIEAHNFQRDLDKYQQENAVIVGVSVDNTDSHKDFCAKQGLTFKLLSDSDKKVVEQYGSMRSMMGMKMAARNTF